MVGKNEGLEALAARALWWGSLLEGEGLAGAPARLQALIGCCAQPGALSSSAWAEAESKGVLARVVGQLGNTRCRLARSGIGTDRLQAEEMGLQGCGGQVGVGRAPPVSFRPIFTDPQQVRALLLQHGEVLICVPSCRGLSLCLFLFISLFCLHAPGTFACWQQGIRRDTTLVACLQETLGEP